MARRKRDRTSKGHKAAEFAMASGAQERLKMYLDRGRRFADLSADELQRAFVSAYVKWGDDPGAPASRIEIGDVDSEYFLRDEELPYSLVQNHLRSAIRKIEAHFKDMPEEQKQEINADLLQKYEKALARKN
jgi:hypothetical protein